MTGEAAIQEWSTVADKYEGRPKQPECDALWKEDTEPDVNT